MRYRKYAAAALVWSCLAVSANAVTIFNGFELPDYGDGDQLTGTNGWVPLEYSEPAQGPVGMIQGSVVKTGEQAAIIMRTSSDPATYGALMPHTGLIPTQQNPVVIIEWDMYALNGTVQSEMWGVSAGNGSERLTVGINAQNKLALRGGQIGTVVTNINLNREVWNHFRMDLRYDLRAAAVYLNNGFIGEWALDAGPVEHTGTSLFNRGFGSNDGAIFDNVTVTAVPEPATLAVTGLGFAGIFARRRRRK